MNRREFLITSGTALAATALSGPFFPAFAVGKKLTIRIGYLPLTDHLLMLAAEREKLPHVTLEPVKFSSWPEITEALKAGKIDGAFLLTPMGLTLRQKGIPLKVVLLGHRNGSVITVKNTGEINRIEDLRGKTIAVPSPFSTHNILLKRDSTRHATLRSSIWRPPRWSSPSPPAAFTALSWRNRSAPRRKPRKSARS